MNKDEIYNVWAPPQSPWSRWVKPVLFAFMDSVFEMPPSRPPLPQTDWLPDAGPAVIIVDLPGDEGVIWGIELARRGYRPIPLYNALPFPLNQKGKPPASRPKSSVNVEPILASLYRETNTLAQMELHAEATPAFLLDADRRLARIGPVPGMFDNRSVCFATDFPSATFLLEHGMNSAIVVQENTNVAGDLLQPLLAWQAAGIQILRKKANEKGPPRHVTVERPSFWRSLWYRLSVAMDLRRGKLGGFGGIVPHSG